MGRRHMPLTDAVQLSAWEKCFRHGRMPWKAVLHVLLLCLLCTQALLSNQATARFARLSKLNWVSLLYPPDYIAFRNDPGDFPETQYFLSTNERVRDDLQHLVRAYFDINATTVDSMATSLDTKYRIARPRLTISRYQLHDPPNADVPTFSELGDEVLMLDNATSLRMLPLDDAEYVKSLRHLTLSMFLLTANVNLIPYYHRHCVMARINVHYAFYPGGQTTATLDQSLFWCPSQHPSVSWAVGLSCLTALLAAALLTLVSKSMWRYGRLLLQIRARFNVVMRIVRRGGVVDEYVGEGVGWGSADSIRKVDEAFSWRNIGWGDVWRIFNPWLIVVALSCCFAIAYACTIVNNQLLRRVTFDHNATTRNVDAQNALLGLACAGMWVSLLQWFESASDYYIVIRTLKRAGPRVLRYIVAVVPILLGYCLFGVIVFACVSDRFGSVTTAAISLFAVLNGDSVRETMLDLDHQTDGPLMSFVLTVYMYSFCCIFIYLALMCFVAIVEEAFFQTRDQLGLYTENTSLPPHLRFLLGQLRRVRERESAKRQAVREQLRKELSDDGWDDVHD